MTSDRTDAVMRRFWRTPAFWIAALMIRIVALVGSALGGSACLAAFAMGVDLTARYDLPFDVPAWVFLIPAIPLLLLAAKLLKGLLAGVEMRLMHEAMQGRLPMPGPGSAPVEAYRSEDRDGFMEHVDSPAFLGPPSTGAGVGVGAAAQRGATSPGAGVPGPATAQSSEAESDDELFAAFSAQKGAQRWDEPTDEVVQRSRRAARRRREEAARREAGRQRPSAFWSVVSALLSLLRFVAAVACALSVFVGGSYLAMYMGWGWMFPVAIALAALTFIRVAKVDVRAANERRQRSQERRDERRRNEER